MRLRGLSFIPFIVGCVAPALHAQRTCFRGPIRAACSGFVLLEATGAASVGDKERVATFPTSREPIRFQDLPGYYSGALGYARVVDSNTAIGGVGELGLGMSNMGDPLRMALKGRWRRQLPNWTLDVGAGALGVQVYNGKRVCCANDAMAYGGTMETALLYKGVRWGHRRRRPRSWRWTHQQRRARRRSPWILRLGDDRHTGRDRDGNRGHCFRRSASLKGSSDSMRLRPRVSMAIAGARCAGESRS